MSRRKIALYYIIEIFFMLNYKLLLFFHVIAFYLLKHSAKKGFFITLQYTVRTEGAFCVDVKFSVRRFLCAERFFRDTIKLLFD